VSIDWTKPIQTRNGRKARLLCLDRTTETGAYPVVALVTDSAGNENAETFTRDGLFNETCKQHSINIINAPGGTLQRLPRCCRWGFKQRTGENDGSA
jgi:hypothetical protein